PSAAAAQGAPRSARPAAGELRARKPEPLAPMPPILRPHSTLCAALSSVPHSILLAAGGGHDVPSSSHATAGFALQGVPIFATIGEQRISEVTMNAAKSLLAALILGAALSL